jgi:predicted Rossmann-fold nucleotide-binding protein
MGGALSSAVLDHQGKVTGVIPKADQARDAIKEGPSVIVEVVDTIDKRKARMQELGDAFIALPGGLGTFEEVGSLSHPFFGCF